MCSISAVAGCLRAARVSKRLSGCHDVQHQRGRGVFTSRARVGGGWLLRPALHPAAEFRHYGRRISVHRLLQPLASAFDRDRPPIQRINALRQEYAAWDDARLRDAAAETRDLPEFMAIAAIAASHVLGQQMFDVQLRGALALTRGSIAEMQTGEGKTLAAVPAIAWFARERLGVHVMTVNDYLARRDAGWMGGIYRFLGLSVAYVQQGMTAAARQAAYRADITYATPNEIGFDFIRDRIALDLRAQIGRPNI